MIKVLLRQHNELKDKLYNAIYDIVNKQPNKLLRFDLTNGCGGVPCYRWADLEELYKEYSCKALTIFDKELCIYYDETYVDNIDYGSDETLLESGEWETLNNGMFLVMPTLVSIGEVYGDYIVKHLRDLSTEDVVELRKEVNLADEFYDNKFNVPVKEAKEFFDGYLAYIVRTAYSNGDGDLDRNDKINKYDNEKTLIEYYNSYEWDK